MTNKCVINCKIRLFWHDARLLWDPAEYNINSSRFSTEPETNDERYIWIPDL